MGELKRLMIHCTATIDGQNILPEDIERMHKGARNLKDGRVQYKGKTYNSRQDLPEEKIGGIWAADSRGRGWSKVGYSKMIALSGHCHQLVEYNEDEWISSDEVTYGAAGLNSTSRHFVYVGGLSSDYYISGGRKKHRAAFTLNEHQEQTLIREIQAEIIRHPKIKVCGHNQYAVKACPSFNTVLWLEEMGFDKKNIDYSGMKVNLRSPFMSKQTGDSFRSWVNDYYPDYAKKIDLDRSGSYKNDFIVRAWYKLRHRYLRHLSK